MPAARSFLYCIELVGAPIAKVGISADPRRRISQLARHAPFAMQFRRVIRFPDHDIANTWERHVHGKANSHRERGEWLRCDDVLDSLLGACPGVDVTGDFAGAVEPGHRRNGVNEAHGRNKALRLQVGPKAAIAAGYNGSPNTYDAAVVRARLADGYGAQDILVMDGIPEDFTWGVVRRLEEKGALRRLLRRHSLAAE